MANNHMPGDEETIRQLIADLHAALSRKDIAGILNYYAEDAVIFNVKPPYQIHQRERWRQVWESSLSHFPASFGTETRHMAISARGNVAIAHYFMRFTGLPGPQPWIRETIVYEMKQGMWKIVHEHTSVPFDPETSNAVFEFE